MKPSKKIELTPEQQSKPVLFFKTAEEYEQFCRQFADNVQEDFDEQREARQRSEAEAKQRFLR